MKRTLARKIENNSGVTLSETLAAVLILLMVSSIVAAGLPVAAKAYHNVVDSSNAQLLLSTTVTNLRDELSDAKLEPSAVTEDGSGVYSVAYTSTLGGASSIIFKPDAVYINSVNISDDENETERKLVSDKAAAGLVFSVDSVAYSDGVVKLTGAKVTKRGQANVLASLPELDIRVLGN